MMTRALAALLLGLLITVKAQQLGGMNARWTWLQGSAATKTTSAVYGAKGAFSTSYSPGSVEGAAAFMYNSSFYMFGGQITYDANPTPIYSNAVWQYKIASKTWGWIAGYSTSAKTVPYAARYGSLNVPNVNNTPPARIWPQRWAFDDSFYMFSGSAQYQSADLYSDLWQFNVTTKIWTWIAGPSTLNVGPTYTGADAVPSGRCEHQGFIHYKNRTLYMFGGYGLDFQAIISNLNDLWKFELSTQQWTFIRGSYYSDDPGTYGQLGVPSDSNDPAARTSPHFWFDENRLEAYMFGGLDYSYVRNDFWKLNLVSSQWTWLGGNDTMNGNGSYGVMGQFSSSNYPPSRWRSMFWQESSYFLMFGGQNSVENVNDLWIYWTDVEAWAWVSGPADFKGNGSYGTKGTESEIFLPSSVSMSAFAHTAGSFNSFMFYGGYINDSIASDDLWSFRIIANPCPRGTFIGVNDSCNYCPVAMFAAETNASACSSCVGGY
jgi:hypothetical protein